MQRVGRINRVASEYDEIYVFNFFPTAETSRHLPLKDRIIEKLQAFHDTLGEDGESSNPELAYLAIIRQIRDNDATLFERVKKLPKKAKTGKFSDRVQDDATISFIRKGSLKTFFRTERNETRQISFMDAIGYLKSRKKSG